jgi:isoquinoline 1-oxidoreductase beta subunit
VSAPVARRDFLKAAGAGTLVVAVSATACRRADDALAGRAKEPTTSMEPVAYVRLDDAGGVTIVCHRSEMGQGIRTSMAAIIADEMEADWARVRVVQADGDEARYGSQNTDGSTSIRNFLPKYLEAGATVRTLLEQAAAQQWSVPATECEARNHEVLHRPSGRTTAYGDLVATAKTLPLPDAKALAYKPKAKYRYIGKELKGVDLFDMTTGRAVFGQDVRREGMRIAVIARPPVYGGTVKSFDAAAAQQVAGVERVLALPGTPPPSAFQPLGGVAVVATNTWAATQGREKLVVEWDHGPNAAYDTPAYRAGLEKAVRAPGKAARSQGDVARALAGAATRVEAEYYLPHLAHAAMEPPAAVAEFTGGKLEVWAPTQHPQAARDTVAKTLGIPVEDVTVHVTLLGGGFGRKSKPDFIVEAAWLAKELGHPVKVVWTREDDLRHDYFHTTGVARLEGGLDAEGRLVGWRHRSAVPTIMALFAPEQDYQSPFELGMGVTDFPYAVPAYRGEASKAPAHTRVGWYRSVVNIVHAFAIGSFLDELARAAGKDPRDFLLQALGPDRTLDPKALGIAGDPWNYDASFDEHPLDTARLRGVLERATAEAGWGTPLPAGEGRGVAVHRSFLTYVAVVAHVRVNDRGGLVIPRVDIAADAGFVANPERTRAQFEGAVVMGVSNALLSEVTFAGGVPQQANFDAYKVARMDSAPREIRVHLVASDRPPGGVGEPGVPPVGPALANAIAAATGRRLRSLPLIKELAAPMA